MKPIPLWRTIPCPRCHAAAGQPCRIAGASYGHAHQTQKPHMARVKRAGVAIVAQEEA